jgi:hypothetical protein
MKTSGALGGTFISLRMARLLRKLFQTAPIRSTRDDTLDGNNAPRRGFIPSFVKQELKMIRKTVGAALLSAAVLIPLSASAQGVPGGVERGAREGERAGGPVGAIVGGTVGGVVGGVSGILGVDERPRFRHYVVEQHRPSYRYQGDVRVGAELPEAGVTYYDVPPEYGAREYRYTVVNDRPVLVDPHTRRIVEIVE